jgi:predicted nucleic acid-binding protein
MKVLVDTSVWIGHLRLSNNELIDLLQERRVLIHSAVVGELACGHISKREQFLNDLFLLPKAIEASPLEVIKFINDHKLYGKGLGWIDVQLLTSAILSEATLMTLDKRLQRYSEMIIKS